MEIKGSEFIAAQEALGKLAKTSELPIKAAYAMSKVLRQGEGASKDLEAARMILLKRYGTLDEKGELVVGEGGAVTLADAEAFNREYLALLEEPVVLTGCHPLTLDEVAGAGLSALDLARLGPFVVEE